VWRSEYLLPGPGLQTGFRQSARRACRSLKKHLPPLSGGKVFFLLPFVNDSGSVYRSFAAV